MQKWRKDIICNNVYIKHEIYFGVPPASGSNDDTWGTYIFEQASDGSFPSQPTLLFQHGMTTADNFRPAGYDLADVDGDGKIELCTVDRGGRRLSVDALTGTDLDGFASFTNEYLAGDDLLGGGGIPPDPELPRAAEGEGG